MSPWADVVPPELVRRGGEGCRRVRRVAGRGGKARGFNAGQQPRRPRMRIHRAVGPSLTARAAYGATRSDYSYRKRRSKVVAEGERW